MTRISRNEVMPKKGSKFENAVVVLSNDLAGDPDVAGSSGAGVSTRGQIYQNRGSSTTVDKRAHSGPSVSFDAGCEVGKTMVEIGGIDSLGVQLDASYGLLLNLLPNHPSDTERRPLKQREAPRVRRAK